MAFIEQLNAAPCELTWTSLLLAWPVITLQDVLQADQCPCPAQSTSQTSHATSQDGDRSTEYK